MLCRTKAIALTISAMLFGVELALAQQFRFSKLTSDQGLSHNSVFSITQDYKGFMWFGTRDGVSRYDSQQISNYYFNTYDPNNESNRVNCVYAIGKELWVGTAVGLYHYNFSKDIFERVVLANKSTYIVEIKRVSTGELWAAGRDGIYIIGPGGHRRHILQGKSIQSVCEYRKKAFLILEGNKPYIINEVGETVVSLSIDDIGQEKLPSFRNYTFFKDQQGEVWLGTNGGLLCLDEDTMTFKIVDWYNRLINNSIRVIRTMSEDQQGNLWLGSESGIVIVNKDRNAIKRYDRSFADDPYGLSDRAVYSSYVARDGAVWLGTYFGGVNYTQPTCLAFHHLFPAAGGQSLSGKAINQLVTDNQQRLWVATEDAGISIQEKDGGKYSYLTRKQGLSDDNVHAVHIDKSGIAWVGTYLGGLNRVDPVTGQTTVYTHRINDSTSVSNNGVYSVYRDRSNTLWVGTVQGLNRMDEKRGTFHLFRPDVLGKTFIYTMLEDATGHLWIATRYQGLYRYDPTSEKLTTYQVTTTKDLLNNQIICLYEDSRRRVWIGSVDGGVCYWDPAQKRFQQPPVNKYLPNQTVYGILEDNQGNLWFSTNKGLLCYDPHQNTYRVFDKSNGLQATQFNFKSSYKDKQGRLYFGSVNGLCFFDPDVVIKRVFDPPVYFTDLKLFNKSVKADSKRMLTRHLDETDEIEFDYSQNVITLDFVAVNYLSKRTNYYTYYLEGFEENWGPKTTLNSQTYTNLSPGQYTFHVRSYQSNGELSPKERTIRIIIHPPFWQSTYAYFIYLLLITGALLLYRRFITILNDQKVAVRMARIEKEKSKELNQQKLNFFTFLSNEFKTPITLIMAEIDELIHSNQAWRSDSATNYKVIKKNAKRLQSLIEQITELRKVDDEPQKVSLTDLDIVTFIKETIQSFEPFLQSRQIQKRLSFSPPYLMASFDAAKLEMILGNIYFFFANELTEGNELTLDVRVKSIVHQPDCELSITFSFDGQQDLFDRLAHGYSVEDEELFRQSTAASIGLLLTFSLLKMLAGKANFDSDGHHHTFSLNIPIRKSPVSKPMAGAKKQEALSDQFVHDADGGLPLYALVNEELPTDKPTLLIADRNRDLAQLLKRHFQDSYRILLAHSYNETQKKAESMLPEMIICENDMHDKTQQNLCKSLKDNPLTQSIPVVLLLNDEDDKTIIDALNSGADGYICKPFNLKELDLMISNELKAVSLLKNKLVNSRADPLLHSLPRRNKEQEFVLRFSTLVNQHYKNKEFSTETMAELMSCSRSQLHTKLNTLTGLSPKEYLNDYRLTLARQLLENGNSVAEVAFDVGFGDPNYFSRAFKKKFGVTPSKMN